MIVLGPYRSGTSITARVVAALGVDFGEAERLIPANVHNPTGYFERNDINRISTQLIVEAGRSLEDPGHPEELVRTGKLDLLKHPFLTSTQPGMLGLKDPRMCATLAAWVKTGNLPAAESVIIHVTRDLEPAVQSALGHPTVSGYAEGDPERLRRMLATYAALAQWHVENMPMRSMSMPYERLTGAPLAATREIARFLGVTNPVRILHAAGFVGKENARLRLAIAEIVGTARFNLGRIKNDVRSWYRGPR